MPLINGVLHPSIELDRLTQEAVRTMPDAINEITRLTAENEKLRGALNALLLQALQSDLNSPANEWGWDAIATARAALAEGAGNLVQLVFTAAQLDVAVRAERERCARRCEGLDDETAGYGAMLAAAIREDE